MWATASARERLLLPAWGVFAGTNAALMYVVVGAETIPFHFVWVSTAVVYGLRPWSLRLMWQQSPCCSTNLSRPHRLCRLPCTSRRRHWAG